jgi:phage regulator Rha-like protein
MGATTKGKAAGVGCASGSHINTQQADFPTNPQPGKGQLQSDGLTLTTTTAEVRIDSRTLAAGLRNKHKAVLTLLDRYSEAFKQHGQLTFKKEVGERKQGGGNAERYALLNEDQAYLLLSLSRNSQIVVALKSKLITAFGEARRAMAMRQTEYLPAYHALHDQIKVLAAGSSHERHMHINFNRLLNKVAGVEPGERIAATVPKQAMLIVGQMLAMAAMQTAPSGFAAYQRAKNALQPLSNAMLTLEMAP